MAARNGIAPASNLEIKVRVTPARLDAIQNQLVSTGVRLSAMRQRDTYFAVAHGRLKVRQIVSETGDATAELIAYSRPDQAGPRWSTYHRVPVDPEQAAALIAALTASVGLRRVVAKQRVVGLLQRTRVHLDRVDGLGAFIELETVVEAGERDVAAAESAEIAASIGIDLERDEIVAGSYAELLAPEPANDDNSRRPFT